MRRLVLHMAVSLDGFLEHGRGAPEYKRSRGVDGGARQQASLELVGQMGLIVIGRGAYEDMVQAWPGSDSPMGRLMNELPKVVFSDSLDTVEWANTRLNEFPLEQEIARLKAEPGRDIVAFGGGRFGHSLIAAGLVDEYRLSVHPVALGRGVGLMHGLPEPQPLELVSAAVYADGVIVETLRPIEAA